MHAAPRTSLPSLPGWFLNAEDGLVPDTSYHNISLSKLYCPFFQLSAVLICVKETASRTTKYGGHTMNVVQWESQTTCTPDGLFLIAEEFKLYVEEYASVARAQFRKYPDDLVSVALPPPAGLERNLPISGG